MQAYCKNKTKQQQRQFKQVKNYKLEISEKLKICIQQKSLKLNFKQKLECIKSMKVTQSWEDCVVSVI